LAVSKLFGIELILNFNLPYFSKNPSEFWRCWHISLSSWLRDYLYISLGGNRRGSVRTYFNLLLTMLLGGLWHGAAWNYVLWGGYQGLLLCGHRILTHGRDTLPSSIEAVSGTTISMVRFAGATSVSSLISTAANIFRFLLLWVYSSAYLIRSNPTTVFWFCRRRPIHHLPTPWHCGIGVLFASATIELACCAKTGGLRQGLLYATRSLLIMGTSRFGPVHHFVLNSWFKRLNDLPTGATFSVLYCGQLALVLPMRLSGVRPTSDPRRSSHISTGLDRGKLRRLSAPPRTGCANRRGWLLRTIAILQHRPARKSFSIFMNLSSSSPSNARPILAAGQLRRPCASHTYAAGPLVEAGERAPVQI
jgi:hypothetical protein